MSRLYLHCVICSRKQADGLISGAAWGRLELPPDVDVEHPGINGSTLRACPTCISSHPDWEDRMLAALGLGGGLNVRTGTAT
jgi:hypothetical protein